MKTFSAFSTLLAAAMLAGCAAQPPVEGGELVDTPRVASAPTVSGESEGADSPCPTEMITDFSFDSPEAEGDVATIESALGVVLPDGVGCVALTPADVGNLTYYVFWPGQDRAFADQTAAALGNAGVSAVSRVDGDGLESADITFWSYPAGDPLHWTRYFGDQQLVLMTGQIPDPGVF